MIAALGAGTLLAGLLLPGPPPEDTPRGRGAEVGRTRSETVKVAGIVLKWVRGDKEANYRRAERMIRQAAARGAKIICTTECFLDGYAIADKSIPLETYRALGEPIPDGAYCRRLMALADELDIVLIAGMLEARGEARYNTAVLIGADGTLLGKYHKQKLGHEQVRNTPGTESLVFPTPHGRAGLMICADRSERSIVEGYRIRGAEFLICPSGGMFGPATNDPIVQVRSLENRICIVFVHPAEFLVTAPDGTIAKRVLLGDRLLVKPEEVDTPVDSKAIIEFDRPVPTALRP
jgi:predicted amidohydrolase